MKSIHSLAFALVLSIVTPFCMAADAADHTEHHPEATSSKVAPQNSPKTSSVQMAKMDAQMKAMRDMHEKMMNAKTPEERNALMAEHMKTMQDGMSMMNGMMGNRTSGKQTMSPQEMQKQMEMMQTMMQMMMDRMGAQTGAKQ